MSAHDDSNDHSIERAEADAFAKALVDRLQTEESSLDPQILSRLQTIRRDAVAHVDSGKNGLFGFSLFRRSSWWLAGSAVAATVLLSVVLTRDLSQPTLDDLAIESLALADIGVSAVAEQELLEDLEFIAWMVEQDESPDVTTQGRG